MSITNSSGGDIYAKPENGDGAVRVRPGETYPGDIDGWSRASGKSPHHQQGEHYDEAYKVRGGLDVEIGHGGKVKYTGPGGEVVADLLDLLPGEESGWKDRAWMEAGRKDWMGLFDASHNPP